MKALNVIRHKLGIAALVVSVYPVMAASTLADETQTIDQLEHKEKSTLDTFHLKEIDSDELSDTVIAGGLEPTSSGGQPSQPVTVYENNSLLEPRDRRTDLGRHEIPVTINYSEARHVPGATYGNNYYINAPGPSNRVYEQFNAIATER